MTGKTYTYEQALIYEVARDLLNTYVADCSAELGIEWAKTEPDMRQIEKIEAIQRKILLERNDMSMTDDAAMRALFTKYRREPRKSAPEYFAENS